MVELHRQGYPGFACTAFLNGGSSDKPNYGVVLKLAAHRSCERELGVASEPGVDLRGPVDTSGPGFVRGKHFTEYVDEVRTLRRHNHDDTAEALLLELVDAAETESAAQGHGVAPWYYEQLAIIYRKEKDYNAEVAILDRFASQLHAPGAQPPKLLERREKARALAAQS